MYWKYTVGKPNSVLNGKNIRIWQCVWHIFIQNWFTGIYLFPLNFTRDSPILIDTRTWAIRYSTLTLELENLIDIYYAANSILTKTNSKTMIHVSKKWLYIIHECLHFNCSNASETIDYWWYVWCSGGKYELLNY